MEHGAEPLAEANRGAVSLWAGMLGAPAAWALQLQTVYMLVPWVCRSGNRYVLHLLVLLFLALALTGGVLSWLEWRRVGGGWPRGISAEPDERTRFLAVVGMLVSALFSLLIIGQGISTVLIDPCIL